MWYQELDIRSYSNSRVLRQHGRDAFATCIKVYIGNIKLINNLHLYFIKRNYLNKYEKEDRYFENTRIITTWIYLTATYFQFLAHFNKGQKEYKKYLKTIKKERIKAVREEFQRIVVVGRP